MTSLINPSDIRELRLKLSLSQEAFGKQLGVSRRQVVRYEMGDQKPSRHRVLRLEYLKKMNEDYRKDELGELANLSKRQRRGQ